jgi:hypothetical protein
MKGPVPSELSWVSGKDNVDCIAGKGGSSEASWIPNFFVSKWKIQLLF